jgi:hypothetical protein
LDTKEFEQRVSIEVGNLKNMLLAKNKAYGNSALEPVRIFAKSDKLEQLRVRIDDKLNRLKQGLADDEDVVLDLLGYLLLYRIAKQGL